MQRQSPKKTPMQGTQRPHAAYLGLILGLSQRVSAPRALPSHAEPQLVVLAPRALQQQSPGHCVPSVLAPLDGGPAMREEVLVLLTRLPQQPPDPLDGAGGRALVVQELQLAQGLPHCAHEGT